MEERQQVNAIHSQLKRCKKNLHCIFPSSWSDDHRMCVWGAVPFAQQHVSDIRAAGWLHAVLSPLVALTCCHSKHLDPKSIYHLHSWCKGSTWDQQQLYLDPPLPYTPGRASPPPLTTKHFPLSSSYQSWPLWSHTLAQTQINISSVFVRIYIVHLHALWFTFSGISIHQLISRRHRCRSNLLKFCRSSGWLQLSRQASEVLHCHGSIKKRCFNSQKEYIRRQSWTS